MNERKSRIFVILNTPLRIALVSLLVSEIVTVLLLWLLGVDTYIEGIAIEHNLDP